MLFSKHDATILENTQSYYPYCKNIIPAQIVSHNKSAYIVKQCPIHGEQWELREEDVAFLINTLMNRNHLVVSWMGALHLGMKY